MRCDVIYHPPDSLSYSQYLKTWEVDSPDIGLKGVSSLELPIRSSREERGRTYKRYNKLPLGSCGASKMVDGGGLAAEVVTVVFGCRVCTFAVDDGKTTFLQMVFCAEEHSATTISPFLQ